MNRLTAALGLAAALACAGAARADDGYGPGRSAPRPPAPRPPAPFALPALSHEGLDAQMDWFVGRLAPGSAGRSAAVAAIARASVEAPVLVPRRLYVGASYPFASALPPDGGLAPGEAGQASGARTMLGNLEGHIRAVFPLPAWLEIGFTLGVVLPTAAYDRDHRPNRSAADAVASLDPTNYVHFLPDRVGLRPGGDLRIRRGRFVFQGRHGIDVFIDDEGIERAKAAGRLLAHVGYLARPDLEVSLEASQIYFFASDDPAGRANEEDSGLPNADRAFAERYRISDGRRTALTLGPALRMAFHEADVGAALLTNLSDPLSPAADGFIGVRVSVIGHVVTRPAGRSSSRDTSRGTRPAPGGSASRSTVVSR